MPKPKIEILYVAFAKDIRFLLNEFIDRQTSSFKVFKEEWKKLNFSAIHNGIPEDVSKRLYLKEVYSAVLGYMMLGYPLRVRIGVVYLLYCLYYTQLMEPKEKICISPILFEELTKLKEEAKKKNIVDVYHLLNDLYVKGAFSFVSYVHIDPILSNLDIVSNDNQNEYHLENGESVLKGELIDANELLILSNEYNNQKFELLEFEKEHVKEEGIELGSDSGILKSMSYVSSFPYQDVNKLINTFKNDQANRKIFYTNELEEISQQSKVKRMIKKQKSKRVIHHSILENVGTMLDSSTPQNVQNNQEEEENNGTMEFSENMDIDNNGTDFREIQRMIDDTTPNVSSPKPKQKKKQQKKSKSRASTSKIVGTRIKNEDEENEEDGEFSAFKIIKKAKKKSKGQSKKKIEKTKENTKEKSAGSKKDKEEKEDELLMSEEGSDSFDDLILEDDVSDISVHSSEFEISTDDELKKKKSKSTATQKKKKKGKTKKKSKRKENAD